MRIGIDLGGTKIEGIILNSDGEVSTRLRVPTPVTGYGDVVNAVCALVKSLQAKADHRLTVGIGTPGALTLPEGVMKNCNSVCLNDQPLKSDIESQLGYAIRLENDANCFALSEALLGAGAGMGTVFGVIIGTGTGGGIVIDGQLLNGPNSIAGEWGHNPVPASVRELLAEDRACYCGRSNCIETVLSGRGMAQTFREITGSAREAAAIAELATAGDAAAARCIDTYCQQLARCLATVVNVLDPHLIVLGGGLSNIDALYRLVPQYLQHHVFSDSVKTVLAPPRFGDASGARGAACLWPQVQE